MSKFAPIHIISGYSFLRSGLTMKRIQSAMKDNDYFGYGLTDEYVMHGWPSFVHIVKEANKPYALGLSVMANDNALVFYAKNEEGYINLINISLAHQKDELTLDYIKEHNNGLICVIETNYGKFKENFSSITSVTTLFTKYLLEIANIFKDNFYLGIEVTSREEIKYANKVREFAKEYTYECVALPRIQYLKKDDAIILRIVDAIQNNEKIEIKKEVGQNYFMNEKDYHKIYNEKEIDNTNVIIKNCSFELLKPRGSILHFPCDNSDALLKEKTYKALNEMSLSGDNRYTSRLDYELSVIQSMGYSDYFLLVQDYVLWAKNNGILVGPGRGSAAGSLISYLLNISEVDPLEFDLQFERFLNPNRVTLPDIDVDFMDIRRDEVVQYMRDKYGSHKVSNIVTYQTIKAKQAIRDIGRVYNIPDHFITLLSKTLKKDKDDKLTLGQHYKLNQEFKDLCDKDEYLKDIVSLAGKIEGLPRQTSVHAAGILLNDVDMEKALPVSIDFSDNYISQYEGKYLEEFGFLKMDFLGIRNLTTINYCVDLINLHYPDIHLDKYHIPYDSKEVFDLIKSGQVIGLFQIDTAVMKKGIKQLKPNCFNDVVALLALNRPGPMAYLPTYAKRRDGVEKVTYLSDDLKDILSLTYGIIVYQEQINQIATKIAGMSPSEADTFRRAISKKDKNVIASNKEKFIKGCVANKYDEKVAIDIFNHIAKFAEYGFNKSHSVAYAMFTCRMAWLKANYPLEFCSAILQTGTSSETKINDYISEMKKRNISILSPSINSSSLLFDVHNNSLLFPFSGIRGLNSLMAENIISERKKGPFTDFFNFVVRMYPHKINEAQILALINSGALDELYSSRASMRMSVKTALQYAELSYSEDGQMNIGISAIVPPSMNEDVDKPIDNLNYEYDALGVMISSNPLDYKKEELNKRGVKLINEASRTSIVKVAGVIKEVRTINTKKGEQMAVIKVFDQSGDLSVTIFPRVYSQAKGYIIKNNILIITGRFDQNEDNQFIADSIETLGE